MTLSAMGKFGTGKLGTGSLKKPAPAKAPAKAPSAAGGTAAAAGATGATSGGQAGAADDGLGFRRFLQNVIGVPPAGVSAAWFKPAAGADRLKHLNAKLHDPAVWNQLSPKLKQQLDGPKGQAYLKHMANDPNFLSAVRTTWNVNVTPPPKLPADKLANLKNNIAGLDGNKVKQLSDLLGRDPSDDSLKTAATANMSGMLRPAGSGVSPML